MKNKLIIRRDMSQYPQKRYIVTVTRENKELSNRYESVSLLSVRRMLKFARDNGWEIDNW